jgi:hypothetical protein
VPRTSVDDPQNTTIKPAAMIASSVMTVSGTRSLSVDRPCLAVSQASGATYRGVDKISEYTLV